MKVSIIGAAGLVGSCTAFALQLGRIVREIALVDLNAEAAAGQALDLAHGSPLVADQRIYAGGYEQIPDSDVICITAGLRRKPDESRLDLINRNVDLFLTLLEQLKAGLKPETYLIVVSNPVDVLTYLAVQRSGLPWQRVIGLGTQLDTARFRSHLAARLKVPATQVQAIILGEHVSAEEGTGAVRAVLPLYGDGRQRRDVLHSRPVEGTHTRHRRPPCVSAAEDDGDARGG